MEFGGGNSCFYPVFNQIFSHRKYYVVDNNLEGLEAFARRIGKPGNTVLINRDILDWHEEIRCDVVFSVGLIEHFSVENTRQAILSHFKALKKGGILILAFPTPTFLYSVTRKILELLGLWIFQEERPLRIQEVMETAREHGELLDQKIIWTIFLTQAILVIKERKI
ncbi:MAG: class I SAM-dependent methyltransferase [Candidatus Aminicenantes bacterium]|nr:MAG: class I SAM-dependent methyltransferase [Candidatus Aminicenantes bacterium]